MPDDIWEVRGCNCEYFCLSFSLRNVLVKSSSERGLEVFYVHNNFCMIPQLLHDFHIDFKPFDLRT